MKGPSQKPVTIDWSWALQKKMVLVYVGKSTNLKNRFKQHVLYKQKTLVPKNGHKFIDEGLKKITTSCQFRAGFEHLFEGYLKFHEEGVKICYYKFEKLTGEDNIQNRFYAEDLAIGLGRPIFNVDSER